MKKLIKDKSGSNLIYIVVLIAILTVFAVGLYGIVNHNTNASVVARNREQAYQIARSVQQRLVSSFLSNDNGLRSAFEASAEGGSESVYTTKGKTVLAAEDDSFVETSIEYDYEGKKTVITTIGHYGGQSYKTSTEFIGKAEGLSSSAITSGITGGIIINGNINAFMPDGSPGNVVINDNYILGSLKKDVIGNIILPTGKVEMGTSSHTITGSVIVGESVKLSGPSQKITGDVIAKGNVNITASAQEIGGRIISRGDVTLTGSSQSVGGGIIADGSVTFTNGGKTINGGISSKGSINISGSGSTINGDVYCLGDLTLSSGTVITGNVYVGGKISDTGGGATIKGNAYVGSAAFYNTSFSKGLNVVGDASFDWGYQSDIIKPNENGIKVSAGGRITATAWNSSSMFTKDNTKCLIFNGARWNNNNNPLTTEALNLLLANMPAVKDSDFSLLDLTLPSDPTNNDTPEYNIEGEDAAVEFIPGSMEASEFATGEDILLSLDLLTNKTLDYDDIPIPEDPKGRTFIFLQGRGTLTLTGSSSITLEEAVQAKLPQRVFIVANPRNGDRITVTMSNKARFYAQFYLPEAFLTVGGSHSVADIYGMVTCKYIGLAGNGLKMDVTSTLNLHQYPGDYSNTGLDSTAGGSGENIFGDGSDSSPSGITWEVLKHYGR